MSPTLKKTSFFLSVFVFSLSFGWLLQAWTGPTSAPPGANVPQPINVSSTDQHKAGRLSATEFYDANDPDFYINPSGASKISGELRIGGDLVDTANAKTVYDAGTGKISWNVLPFKKGAITSDWDVTDYTAGFYDVGNLTADKVEDGVAFGRGLTGSLQGIIKETLGSPCSAGYPDSYFGSTLSSLDIWYPADHPDVPADYWDFYWNEADRGSSPYFYCAPSGKMYSPTRSGTLTWANAVTYCNGLDLYGYTDWRLPTMEELRNDFGVSACSCVHWSNCATIPSNCHGQSSCNLSSQCGSWDPTATTFYWSSTEAGNDAYIVSFNNGYVGTYNKAHGLAVRCVRGQ